MAESRDFGRFGQLPSSARFPSARPAGKAGGGVQSGRKVAFGSIRPLSSTFLHFLDLQPTGRDWPAARSRPMLKQDVTLCGDEGRSSRRGRKRKVRVLRALLRDESGATAIEYGLIAALIAIAAIAAFTRLGLNLAGIFQTIAAALGGG